tara:strand:+ start:30 stop:878 length:849 start_codon:yes stop_codon:yes gene_type:complete
LKDTILITGANGFIGNHIYNYLNEKGYDVWGVGFSSSSKKKYKSVDLLDYKDLEEVARVIPKPALIIHCAAIAHKHSSIPVGYNIISANTNMTENVINVFENKNSRVIFLSSIAVYGEDKRSEYVLPTDELRPSSSYGMSKMISEERFKNSIFRSISILRLAPVFDDKNLLDIKKRVFLPFFSKIKMKIYPEPIYSLASIETVLAQIYKEIVKSERGKSIMNVADSKYYPQSELSTWFNGISIPFPSFVFLPFYYLSYLFFSKGYKIRCIYYKVFKKVLFIN